MMLLEIAAERYYRLSLHLRNGQGGSALPNHLGYELRMADPW